MNEKEPKRFRDIDKRRFHIRKRIQEHITRDGVRLGYKSFFTDYNNDTLTRGYFLMEDEMLVIVNYPDKRLEAYLSARGYLKAHVAELEAAKEFDAVSLLNRALNKTPQE
jgi:hypothetical protein